MIHVPNTRPRRLTDDCYMSYVNLDRRPDRRQRMEESLRQLGLSALRTRGMLPEEYKGPPARIQAMWDRPQKGAIGCHFSQVSVMQEALMRKQHAFVMEDDLVFCQDFNERVDHITHFTNHHPWDVFFLGGTFHINPPYWHKDKGRDAECTDDPRFMRTYGAFCTYAYIVNLESLPKILRNMDLLLPRSIGIDHLFIMMQPKINAYAYVPGCIKQYDHVSDIGVDRQGRPGGMTVFSNFAKLNGTIENSAYWWQDLATDFDPTTFDWHEARNKT
jgi:GR25 family glycosyltransferase involved in LPS biosynthesis